MTSIPPLTPQTAQGLEARTNTVSPELESARAFEEVFLGQMIDEMMKTVDIGETMGAHAADMWRSVLSQAIAENLAENGGLGIAGNIYEKMNAYKPQTGGSDGQT